MTPRTILRARTEVKALANGLVHQLILRFPQGSVLGVELIREFQFIDCAFLHKGFGVECGEVPLHDGAQLLLEGHDR